MIKLKITNHIRQDRLQATVQDDNNIMVINSIKSFVQYIFMYPYFRYLVKKIIEHLLTLWSVNKMVTNTLIRYLKPKLSSYKLMDINFKKGPL